MAQFSQRERLIASLLSATPGLKKFVKHLYILINALIYRKNYRFQILDERCGEIERTERDGETFFGYYDKSPESISERILFNEATSATLKKPSVCNPIKIWARDVQGHKDTLVAETTSYTWQQGCRAMWLNKNEILFNVFEEGQYKAVRYSVINSRRMTEYPYPVQDAYRDKFYISLNYRRVMRLRPDYGYRNLVPLSDEEMQSTNHDGLWRIDLITGENELVVTLSDVMNLCPKASSSHSLHKLNHVMIAPDGKKMIFIHRWYSGKRRFDRLILSDYHRLRVLADDDMVSHICWVNDQILFGYFRHNGKAGFYYLDTENESVTSCDAVNAVAGGDGHPSCYGGRWIVFDSYPDKSRMQHLYLYDRQKGKVIPLLELYHGIGYSGECRCDLHPRFSSDGRHIYFDTVYSGQRRFARIDITSIISE